MTSVTFDISKTLDKFNRIGKDANFLISKSMNDTAFLDVRTSLSKQIKKDLFIRNKGLASKFMFQVSKSNKKHLEVSVKHKIDGLGLQQRGGTELPSRDRLSVPNRKNIEKHLGISKMRNIPKNLRIGAIITNAPTSKDGSAYKVKGKSIFIRKNTVFVNNKGSAAAIYHFVKKATHDKKGFHIQEAVEGSFDRRFARYFNRNYLKMLKG